MGIGNTDGFAQCTDAQQAFEWGSPAGVGADGVNCDPDCGIVDSTCTIPLDGGLSLLALAGGGLATAAMRRRREEDEAAQESA